MVKKEIPSVKNWRESFWETALRSYFISQGYSFSLQKPFDKTVFVEFVKWYLEAHRALRWKWKYPKMKTEKKLSGKLFCVLLVYLTELQLSPQEAFS